MNKTLLMLNVGSSSLKFSLFADKAGLPLVFSGGIERIGKGETTLIVKDARTGQKTETPVEALKVQDALPALEKLVRDHSPDGLVSIGHRVVHGGPDFTEHQRVTLELLEALHRVEALAPNHLPLEIAFMKASLEQFSDISQIACFDTVFHRDLPFVARLFALPRRLEQTGVRRYGFHGLSYAYLMQKLPEYIGDKAKGRIILAHLGSGASMAAVKQGKSIDTTMGMTPLGGLVMATRCGDLDPGIPAYLAKTQGIDGKAFEHMAYAESGLLGLSETSGDVRDLLAAEAKDPRAAEALAIFCYQARKWIGALAAALEGLDVLVFTGGIGEHSAVLRQRICDDLDWMGVTLDPQANRMGEPCVSAPASKIMVFAIPTDEEREMAEICGKLLQ